MTEYRHRLTQPQANVFRSPARFRLLNAGRRFGKTHLAVLELINAAVNKPESVNWYVAPTYRQAEQIAWAKLKALLPPEYISKKDEGDLSIILPNKSTIALRGADNPDSLRGPGLDFVVFDEAAFQKQEAWTEVIRPSLSDKLGRALFISTPSGYNWFYDLFSAAQGRADWKTWQYTTLEGGHVPLSEIESARSELDKRTFQQEYEAFFESLAGRVYYAFDRRPYPDGNISDVKDIDGAPILVGMDFNINPMSAVFAVKAGGQIHVIGEATIDNGNTDEMVRLIKSRYPNRTIRVYPDPTGNARKTSAPVGQTDFTILRQAGFQVLAPSRPYPVVDKINTVNAGLRTAAGDKRVLINPTCRQLTMALDGLTYVEGTNEPDKSSGLDHITDALGYLLLWELPLRGSGGAITLGAL
jgi:hypothetical protein